MPIVSRHGGDNYILTRYDECDYAPATSADNSDPPITGGGRVLLKGQWPEWWENWEEPQPTEPHPSLKESLAKVWAGVPLPTAAKQYRWAARVELDAEISVELGASADICRKVRARGRKERRLLLLLLLD